MPHDPRKTLQDVLDAGAFILKLTHGMDWPAYMQNEVVRSAVERKFTIVGEAISRLLLSDAALAAQITNYRKIIDFRNALIHGYSSVDDQVVWDAIHNHLPLLLHEAATIQSSLN